MVELNRRVSAFKIVAVGNFFISGGNGLAIITSPKKDMNTESLDTSNMCSHLQKKLFEEDGLYHGIWVALQDDPELTAVVRSRQLHVYRNGKKVLVLAGKAAPKVIREDKLCEMLPKEFKRVRE